jgi:hypothetical protein
LRPDRLGHAENLVELSYQFASSATARLEYGTKKAFENFIPTAEVPESTTVAMKLLVLASVMAIGVVEALPIDVGVEAPTMPPFDVAAANISSYPVFREGIEPVDITVFDKNPEVVALVTTPSSAEAP